MAVSSIVSECSGSGDAARSGLLCLGSPSHCTDGLNSLSRKMLGGLHRALHRCMPGRLLPDYFPRLYGGIPALRTELTYLGRRCDKLPFSDLWHQSLCLFGISRGSNPHAPLGIECPWRLPSGGHVEGPRIRLHCWSPYTLSGVHIGLYLLLGTSGRRQPPDPPAFWSRQSAWSSWNMCRTL